MKTPGYREHRARKKQTNKQTNKMLILVSKLPVGLFVWFFGKATNCKTTFAKDSLTALLFISSWNCNDKEFGTGETIVETVVRKLSSSAHLSHTGTLAHIHKPSPAFILLCPDHTEGKSADNQWHCRKSNSSTCHYQRKKCFNGKCLKTLNCKFKGNLPWEWKRNFSRQRHKRSIV